MSKAVMLDNLGVQLDNQTILSEVSFALEAGRVTGLLGPSGSGKTTLMRVLAGLQRPSAGTVMVLGREAGHRELRRQVGYAAQSIAVYPDLTVGENLRYFAAMTNAPASRVAEVAADVDLAGQTTQLVRTLSGGQRARVSLAVALLGRPKLLILDEPTVGLDPLLRVQLWQYFHELAAAGTTLLISSHVMDEAERCDDLVLMRAGRILTQGTPAAVKRQAGAKSVETAFINLIGGTA